MSLFMDECSICYESIHITRCIRMDCGHVLHASCLKDWYVKSSSETPTCPMCRGPIVFKKSTSTLHRWKTLKEVEHENDMFEEFLEEVFENVEEDIHDERLRKFWLEYLKDSLTVYHVMCVLEYSETDIEHVLWNNEWISPRWMNRWVYFDWKFPEKATLYPKNSMFCVQGCMLTLIGGRKKCILTRISSREPSRRHWSP